MSDALRLAGSLEHHTEQVKASNGRLTFVLMTPEETTAVAAELRRLHAENEAMKEALEEAEKLDADANALAVSSNALADSVDKLIAPTPRKPKQEPWSTRERFYAHLDQAVENIRQRMTIRTVTMRCKDFDYVLPIIDAMEGHVLVGPAPIPRKPLTDEEIKTIWGSYFSRGLEFARAIERAHGIKEQEHE